MASDIYFIIVNPNAGSGKIRKDWNLMSSFLMKKQIIFDVFFTVKPKDAYIQTIESIKKGYLRFIAVGGDGTLNEILNGIFSQNYVATEDITLGMIPVGTGNDWCRMHNIPFNYQKVVNIIKKNNLLKHDVGKVNISNNNSTLNHYFINVCGIGYDALVAKKTNEQKALGKKGKILYFKNIFQLLINYKTQQVKIESGSFSENIPLFSMNIGICKYNGGGMMQLPNAKADDGLLDVTIIRDISKIDLIFNINKLFNGKIYKHSKVSGFQCKSLTVENMNEELHIETDGESLGYGKFTFEIIPGSINVIVP